MHACVHAHTFSRFPISSRLGLGRREGRGEGKALPLLAREVVGQWVRGPWVPSSFTNFLLQGKCGAPPARSWPGFCRRRWGSRPPLAAWHLLRLVRARARVFTACSAAQKTEYAWPQAVPGVLVRGLAHGALSRVCVCAAGRVSLPLRAPWAVPSSRHARLSARRMCPQPSAVNVAMAASLVDMVAAAGTRPLRRRPERCHAGRGGYAESFGPPCRPAHDLRLLCWRRRLR